MLPPFNHHFSEKYETSPTVPPERDERPVGLGRNSGGGPKNTPTGEKAPWRWGFVRFRWDGGAGLAFGDLSRRMTARLEVVKRGCGMRGTRLWWRPTAKRSGRQGTHVRARPVGHNDRQPGFFFSGGCAPAPSPAPPPSARTLRVPCRTLQTQRSPRRVAPPIPSPGRGWTDGRDSSG